MVAAVTRDTLVELGLGEAVAELGEAGATAFVKLKLAGIGDTPARMRRRIKIGKCPTAKKFRFHRPEIVVRKILTGQQCRNIKNAAAVILRRIPENV